MRLKCEVGFEKIKSGHLLGKNEMTFRTTQYIVFSQLISKRNKVKKKF